MTPEQIREIKEIVEDMLKRELLHRFIFTASVAPDKILPLRPDGTLPADGDSPYYEAASGIVRF